MAKPVENPVVTYFGINLIDIDDLQGIFDCFPVIPVID